MSWENEDPVIRGEVASDRMRLWGIPSQDPLLPGDPAADESLELPGCMRLSTERSPVLLVLWSELPRCSW